MIIAGYTLGHYQLVRWTYHSSNLWVFECFSVRKYSIFPRKTLLHSFPEEHQGHLLSRKQIVQLRVLLLLVKLDSASLRICLLDDQDGGSQDSPLELDFHVQLSNSWNGWLSRGRSRCERGGNRVEDVESETSFKIPTYLSKKFLTWGPHGRSCSSALCWRKQDPCQIVSSTKV